MTQENEKLISGEETQPEEPMTLGSRIIDDPVEDLFDSGTTDTVTNQDFVKHGADIQESFGSNSAYEVNLRKGKLFFTQHLFTAEGLHLPASFAVSYNQRFASSNYTTDGKPLLFKGWKLNYQQFIRFVDDKCVYVDGAFKEHVFKRSTNNTSVYLDVSTQSGTILRPATDDETFADYAITDGANTDLFFKDNRLVKIRQIGGSTPVETTITYDTLNRVTQVTDGVGNNYAVNYLTNAVTITDANGTVLATLTADSNNCLTSVDYYEDTDSGKVCEFTYYSSTYLLSNVRDQFAQEKAVFAYYEDGKFGTMGRYVIKGETSTEVHNKHIIYNTDHTIVAQSHGSMFDEAKIRYKYAFNTDGTLANVCEIDSTGNTIGERTFVKYDNGVEQQVTYKEAEVINLWEEDWPAGIGPGVLIQGPIEVGNETISIPNPNDNVMDVTLSWHMEYEDPFLPYPDSIITVELLVNDAVVCTREYSVEESISIDETYTATGIPTATETNIILRVTPPYSEQPVFISNVQATYIPYSEYKKEMYIKNPNPNDLAFAIPMYMTEIVNDEVVYWYPVSHAQFLVNGNFVYPNVFTINDYTKTMQSYFLTGKYNFYYNDCNDVIYQATSVSISFEDQDFELVDAPLEIMTKSIIPISFERMSIDDSKLKISQRRYGTDDEYSYSKLDTYLRPVEEFRAGTPIQTHFYDSYGNETTRYVGGTEGIKYTSTYSTNGQSVTKEMDYIHTDTHTTSYDYNADGLVHQVTTPIGQEINYEYQDKNILNRISAVVDNQTSANDITYDGPLISGLSHNGTSFQFVYDERKNISEVKVAGATLLSKTVSYSINGSYFTECAYANGRVIYKFYDKYDRLIKLSEGVNGPVLARFIYSDKDVPSTVTDPTDPSLSISGSSKLRVVVDTSTSTTNRTTYTYDDFGRVSKVEDSNMTITPTMDNFNRVEKVECNVGLAIIETNYEYASNTDDSLLREEIPLNSTSNISTSYTRDDLKRPVSTTVMHNDYGYKTTISYAPRQTKKWVKDDGPIQIIKGVSAETNAVDIPPISGHWEITTVGTTNHVWQFREYNVSGTTATLVRTDAIEYDANGNITKYGNITYKYDGLNRLVRENNPGIDKTITWCYDIGGNITSRSEYAYTTGTLGTPTKTFTYVYDESWKDQLTSYNGQSIIYDQVGNPTTYRGASLTWERGRNLANYHVEDDIQYFDMCYDASGKRVSKRLTYEDPAENEVTTYYIYNGNNLVCEKVDDGGMISYKYYLYNSQGVIGYVIGSTVYTYRKNMFGDIVAIYQGATKVAEYAYDAWGNCTIVSDTWNIGASNPFRYRGYYWDNDLGLYYLMSRYYDPQTGRFINADGLEHLDPQTIGGLNPYAYCRNNPVMYTDPLGTDSKWWEWALLGLAIVIATGFVVAGFVLSPVTLIGNIALGAVAGFGAGFLAATSSNLYNQLLTTGFESVDISQVWSAGFREGAIGAFTGAITAGFAFGFEIVGKAIGNAVGYDLAGSVLGRFLNIGVGFYKSVGKAVGIVVGATIGLTIASNILGENENFSENVSGGISNLLEDLFKSLIK